MLNRITWREARDLMLDFVRPVDTEALALSDAFGRILAEDFAAVQDVPPFDRSPFDGYAFRSEDTQGELPVTLTITEEIPAGSVPTITVTPGTAAKILTGAPLPPGADAITKFEDTDFTAETVTLKKPYAHDEDVIHRGEDVAAGDPLAHRGQRMDAGLAGALASQGIPKARFYRRPVVGIITTGSELIAPEEMPSEGKIPNSNRYMLEMALQQAGCVPRYFASPRDDTETIARCIGEALASCDALVTTGGVSVGDYDLTAAAYEAAGVELLCGNLRLKPGGKSCFGRFGGKPVLGLSGNPASSMTCFYAVALPVLRRLVGLPEAVLPELPAVLGTPFRKKSPNPRLLRGVLTFEEGRLVYYPADKQGNGALHTLAGVNALAELPAKTPPLEAGAAVNIIYLG